MTETVKKVFWTLQARETLNDILDYRYKNLPTARKIVRKDIIDAAKEIVFSKQYQQDEIFPQYRKITVRDYRILYKDEENDIYIMHVVCTKAGTSQS